MSTRQKDVALKKQVWRRLTALISRPVKNAKKTFLVILEVLETASRCKVWRKIGREKSQLHRYILFSYDGNKFPNPGDNIQTIATKRAILQVDERATFIVVPRNKLIFYKNQPLALCVMQGWFEHRTLNFMPGKSVIPVWVGTHWQNFIRLKLSYLLRIFPNALRGAEIGCRDKSTLEFCKKHGAPAYFSRCLTLTLSRRTTEPKSPRIFVVSCPDWAVSKFPQQIKENAIFIEQREAFLTNEETEELLARYRDEAGLVITSALHCAQPCIAMGIPVVFIDPSWEWDGADRFSAMHGIVPIWKREDLENGRVDFSPKAPDIEPLKALLIENLDLSIRKAKGLPFDAEHLQQVRQKIEEFSVA